MAATHPQLIAAIRIEQECRSTRDSGVGWLVVAILAGVLSSAVGAYVVTALSALGVVYALGVIFSACRIAREVAR